MRRRRHQNPGNIGGEGAGAVRVGLRLERLDKASRGGILQEAVQRGCGGHAGDSVEHWAVGEAELYGCPVVRAAARGLGLIGPSDVLTHSMLALVHPLALARPALFALFVAGCIQAHQQH